MNAAVLPKAAAPTCSIRIGRSPRILSESYWQCLKFIKYDAITAHYMQAVL